MFLDHVTLFRYAAHEQKSAAWTAADEVALAAWWKEFQGYVESKPAQGERRMENNHGSWYDADWLSISLFNGDSASAKAAAEEAQHRRIALQITPNGSEWIELERNVPSGYCQYNLMALTTVADLAASAGAVDVWGFETDAGPRCGSRSTGCCRSRRTNPRGRGSSRRHRTGRAWRSC